METPAPTPAEQAAQAAAAAAAKQFNIEAFTLLAIGLIVTMLRTYARISAVGFRRLQVDDYLVWFAAVCYGVETGLAYSVGNAAHGLANNGMTPAERVGLSVDDPEFGLRVLGSKIQLAGWTTYGTLLWALKGSLLVFYTRLTHGLGRNYELRIYVGYVLVIVSYMVIILNLFLGCRPFHRNWQINPDPGDTCQPAISQQVVWVYLSFNVITDMYLLSIPLPMLFMSSLRPLKKFGLMILFGGGILVIACATLRCVLIVTDPVNGAQAAGGWAVRETFIAVVTTNLPMVYPLFHKLLGPYISSWVSTLRSSQKTDQGPRDFVTYGGSGPSGGSKDEAWHRRPSKANPLTNVTFSESEERMVGGGMGPVEMHDIKPRSLTSSAGKNASPGWFGQNIQKDVKVEVVSESRTVEDSRLDRQQQQQALASLDEGNGRHQGHFTFARGPTPSQPKEGDEV